MGAIPDMLADAERGPGMMVLERGDRPGLLRVIGEVDASNADYFASILLAESYRVALLTVDVRRLRFLGGDGLRAILRTAKGLHDRGGALHLAGPNRLIRRMLTVLRAATAPGLVVLDNVALDGSDVRPERVSPEAPI